MNKKFFNSILILAALSVSAPAQAEPISRTVTAEIIVGYDFIVLQQQGDTLSFKYSDPENFRTRADDPVQFSFTIDTTRDDIDACSVRFITWRQQVSEAMQAEFNRGGSMDVFFTPGLAGRVTADKTVITGQGDFSAAYSTMTADFFGPTNGEPLAQAQWEEILASLLPPETLQKLSSPRDGKPFKGRDIYPFAEFFSTIPEGEDPKILQLLGNWSDERYAVYTLPCSSLITLPPLEANPSAESLSELLKDIAILEAKNSNQTKTINQLNGLLSEPLTTIQVRDDTIKSLQADVLARDEKIKQLEKDKAALTGENRIWKIAAGVFGLLSIGLGGLLLLRPKGRTPLGTNTLPLQNTSRRKQDRPSKPLERPEGAGVIFPASPMQAANVATPLSPAGQLTASNLQMLTGPFKVLRPAYHATGRIGYAQEGLPSSADYSFGTGFLITPNHVMTNRHVHGFYGHYLTSDEDCGGIEFIAEKGKDASDFIPFNGQPPLLLEGLDIAIYTLSRSAGNRTPVDRVSIPTSNLEGRDIAVIGYPDTHEPNNPDILSVVEDNPIFAVKRISQGQIFRHSTDIDDPYGVQVKVNKDDKASFPMTAICHNASTLGGNSGSPILDIETGELLGVHFAGHKIFNKKEAANLAMAIEQLAKQSDIKNV